MMDAAAILALLVALSVKVLLLVVLGAAVARGLRGASAACRHVLWSAVLGGVLVLTLTAPVRPMWSLPITLPAAMLPPAVPGSSSADSIERVERTTSSPRSVSSGEPLAHAGWQVLVP